MAEQAKQLIAVCAAMKSNELEAGLRGLPEFRPFIVSLIDTRFEDIHDAIDQAEVDFRRMYGYRHTARGGPNSVSGTAKVASRKFAGIIMEEVMAFLFEFLASDGYFSNVEQCYVPPDHMLLLGLKDQLALDLCRYRRLAQRGGVDAIKRDIYSKADEEASRLANVRKTQREKEILRKKCAQARRESRNPDNVVLTSEEINNAKNHGCAHHNNWRKMFTYRYTKEQLHEMVASWNRFSQFWALVTESIDDTTSSSSSDRTTERGYPSDDSSSGEDHDNTDPLSMDVEEQWYAPRVHSSTERFVGPQHDNYFFPVAENSHCSSIPEEEQHQPQTTPTDSSDRAMFGITATEADEEYGLLEYLADTWGSCLEPVEDQDPDAKTSCWSYTEIDDTNMTNAPCFDVHNGTTLAVAMCSQEHFSTTRPNCGIGCVGQSQADRVALARAQVGEPFQVRDENNSSGRNVDFGQTFMARGA